MLFYKTGRFLYEHNLEFLAILVRIAMRLIFSCDISYKIQIGKGTIFPHDALGVVIHQDAKIGNNCIICQNVTIGGRSDYNELPVIKDNVIIGANVVILGPVIIGENSKIGAGAIVVDNVPSNSTVTGNKAKVIKTNEP